MIKVLRNKEKNGIELYFEQKPKYEIIQKLKECKFKWHNGKKCWYAKENENTLQVANNLSNGKEIETIEKQVQENYLGVKVGDIFECSWGYEQTNVDFYRVKALKGKTQVILQQVALHIVEEEYMSNGLASNKKYDTSKYAVLKEPYGIEDNEKGFVKKVSGTKDSPYIKISSFQYAYRYYGGTVYESWYY